MLTMYRITVVNLKKIQESSLRKYIIVVKEDVFWN